MKKFLASGIIAAAALFAVFVSADFDAARWEFRAKISGGESRPGAAAETNFVVLDLPAELFSHLKPDLSDLRVVNPSGWWPYVAAAERETETYTAVPARMFNLSSARGESTTFVVDVGANGVFHNSLTVSTPSENFRRIVEIHGSNDQNSWRMLNPRGQIYDYTVRDIKPVAVRDTRVSYPDSTFRYLLVKILDQGEAPLKITGVKIKRSVSISARELTFTPGMETADNGKDKTTDIVLDLGDKGIPHRRGRITTSSANFSRAVAIYDSDDKTNWRLLTHAYLYSISTSNFTGSNLDFAYPESTKKYLKLSILNKDDQPISAGNVTLFGVVRRILFSYDDPSKEYYLYLGNPAAKRPQYDIEKISQYVDVASLNRVSVGAAEKNPYFVPIAPPKPPLSERSPYILPTVLGVVVAVLAFLLMKIVVKTKSQALSGEKDNLNNNQ